MSRDITSGQGSLDDPLYKMENTPHTPQLMNQVTRDAEQTSDHYQETTTSILEMLPREMSSGNSNGASQPHGTNYSVKSEHMSPESNIMLANDHQKNVTAPYLQYPDDSKLAIGRDDQCRDNQYISPYTVPPQKASYASEQTKNAATGIETSTSMGSNYRNNYNKPIQDHLVVGNYSSEILLQFVNEMKKRPNYRLKTVSIIDFAAQESTDPFILHLCFTFNSRSIEEFDSVVAALRSNTNLLKSCEKASYHVIFSPDFKWSDAPKTYHDSFNRLLDTLKDVAGSKVEHCSIIKKYESSTIYITEIDALVALGKEISQDIERWDNLKILDYSHNCLRLLPGVKLPETLQVLNLSDSCSLETLAGFKFPSNLQVLDVSNAQLKSIDYVFPFSLRRLDLLRNSIYSLDYVKLPQQLSSLDLSQNRIDTIKYVSFPRDLTYLSIAHNPIECMKGARFPENLEYLDLSCIPNESMAGIKFPDSTLFLNLQLSMTNTRGLKLSPYVRELNMACDGVNSINPLKLPNSIEKLFLNNNNIKTLSKVTFPTALKELYLGNNLITTLKNVLFPPTLEVLDMEMNPDLEDNEKDISSLKDVIFPPNLRILRLGYHLIKAVESIEFPYFLEELNLRYNDLRMFRNVKFGPRLRLLDLSGNQELMSVDNVLFPETLVDMKIPSTLLSNLPADVVKRANKRELVLTKSLPYTI